MNKKINTICFIFLFFFLICSVSAADNGNETINTIQQPNPNQDICTMSIEDVDCKLEAANVEKISKAASSLKTVKKEKVTLKAPDIKMHYKDGTTFTVTVKDKNKKAISKAKVKITINGKTYSKSTDKTGKTSINLNLNRGTYTVLTMFPETSKYLGQSVKSSVTIKSTIKCNPLTKYYKNNAAYYSTFYDKKGKLLKNTAIKFKLNSKTYSVKTNKNGVGKLNIDLKPGIYSITSVNSKTSESVTKIITIKSILETKDMNMNQDEGSKFNVKVLNCYGKASPNKKVTLKVNGKTYTQTSNQNGIASLPIDLEAGKYQITTEYEGLKNTNYITINKVIKTSSFKHTTTIPNYVNVTIPYAFHNAQYSLKTGLNGTVKLPKIETFTVEVGSKIYYFATGKTGNGDAVTMENYHSYLVPFKGSCLVSSKNKNLLVDDGIMITRLPTCTEIEYRSHSDDRVELFGFYADKGTTNSEILTYLKNHEIMGKVSIQTHYYDETGVRYSLAKLYQRANTDFAYYEITNHVSNPIVFTNTGKPVTYNYYETSIAGYQSKEDITTRFSVNGKEELEKHETISYGLGDKYRRSLGFEVLQSYSIINEKINKNTLENWINKNSNYLNRFSIMNVYAMHLASLETAWLADEQANKYKSEFNVDWKRDKTLTILGGINLEDTYLNILNADMAMSVTGNNNDNIILFKFINSMNLPNIEDYVLSNFEFRFMDNTTSSLDNVFNSIAKNNFSVTQIGDMIYLFSEDESKSAIVLNSTSGVANVIMCHNNDIYKGSSIATSCDCCSVGIMPQDLIRGIRNTFDFFSNGIDSLLSNSHPLTKLLHKAASTILAKTLTGASKACYGLFLTMNVIQDCGNLYREKMISQKDWHATMDLATFTRPGYLQGKKIYNIPNKNGSYDYIEVEIKDDLTLNRNNAIYISDGSTKQLSKDETYQYFSDEYWTPFSMPTKYWDKSWKGA